MAKAPGKKEKGSQFYRTNFILVYSNNVYYTAVVDVLGMILVKFSPFRINTKGPFVKFIN